MIVQCSVVIKRWLKKRQHRVFLSKCAIKSAIVAAKPAEIAGAVAEGGGGGGEEDGGPPTPPAVITVRQEGDADGGADGETTPPAIIHIAAVKKENENGLPVPTYSAGGPPLPGRWALLINRPPTGGDLTFSWKKGHI